MDLELVLTSAEPHSAIDTKGGYLSRQQYLSLSERGHSTYVSHRGLPSALPSASLFLTSQCSIPDAVYTIFEAYRARKNQQHDFDRSERWSLLRQSPRVRVAHRLTLTGRTSSSANSGRSRSHTIFNCTTYV